jgi:protein ImuA
LCPLEALEKLNSGSKYCINEQYFEDFVTVSPPVSRVSPSSRAPLSPAPWALTGQVWRADELAADQVLPTGLPLLDAALPGGGWPVGALVEVLQARSHAQVWQLLAPALAQAVRQQAGPVVLVGPPYPTFVPGLAARGLPPQRLLWVRTDAPASRLWATEQALRCADVAAVLAWLPRAQSADLRRLQLAAQRHQRLLFVLRPEAARVQASPARLRLWLAPGDALEVHVLKRRGPPLAAPVRLPPQPAALAYLLQARTPQPLPLPLTSPDRPHGLDRATSLA